MLRTITHTKKMEEPVTIAMSANDMGLTAGSATKAGSNHRSSRSHSSRALHTIALLQTTLELSPMLRLFSREVNDLVPHCGVVFQHKTEFLDITLGRTARYCCKFRLVLDKQLLGEIDFFRGKPFNHKDMSQLEYMLGSLLYPLRNALQYLKATQAAMTDPLTGEYNRSVMESTLQHEMGLYRRYRTPLSLLVVDIDKFKTINDTLGHKVGDSVIQTVSKIIKHSLRESDVLSRYGGDEFTVLLSNTRLHGARKIAEHIRRAIEKHDYTGTGKLKNVTVSIGVAALNCGDSNNSLFQRADKALLRAKRHGRNCICAAPYR